MRDARKRSREDIWLHFGVLIGTIQRHECWNDDLRCVFREFPMLGLEPMLAARAALASRAQGLYEPPHWALLVADVPFDLDHIPGAARSVGLDAERLARDMEDASLDALIERNAILGQYSRRQGSAGLRHRRWHDPQRPATAAVPRSHRGRAGRAGRRVESERRRLKRGRRHPDRAAAGAGGRGASSVATTVPVRR